MGSRQARPILEKMRSDRGNKCLQCSSVNRLEFAHLRPTGLRGRGRGMDARMRDIKNHPNDYILLCRKCHLLLDSIHKNLTSKKGRGRG